MSLKRYKIIACILIHVWLLSACSNAVEDVDSELQKPGPPDNSPPQTTATPPSDTLSNQTYYVSLACTDDSTSGCTIYYTTDARDPSLSSNVYISPIMVTASMELRFFAVDATGNAESIQRHHYYFDNIPPVASASPLAMSSRNPFNVTLSCDDSLGSGCNGVYYTLDNSDPTLNSTQYSDIPITINSNTVVKFFAVDYAGNSSTIQSQQYAIDQTIPIGTPNPASGSILQPMQSIQIVFSESMIPSSLQLSGSLYPEKGAPFWAETYQPNDTLIIPPNSVWSDGLNRSFTINATDIAGNPTVNLTLLYSIDSTPPTVIASPDSQTTNAPFSVSLSCSDGAGTGCDSIYYTTNGNVPTANSPVYSSPITISSTTTLRFFAVDNANLAGPPQTEVYTIETTSPTVLTTIPSSSFLDPLQPIEIVFSESMNTTSIDLSNVLSFEAVLPVVWTSTNNTNDTVRIAPMSAWSDGIDRVLTVSAEDLAGNALNGGVTLTYTVDSIAPVVTPNPPGASGNTAINVALNCDDGPGSGCDAIYFSTDGNNPTASLGNRYTVGIFIDTDTTLKFFAVDFAGNAGSIQTEQYSIDTVSPVGYVYPPSGAVIGTEDSLVVRFSETMDVNSLVVSGIFSGGQLVWSSTAMENDTLTITPPPSSYSLDSQISINAQDLAGNPTNTITGNYDIGILHVSINDSNASDGNPGTRALPFMSLQAAINRANQLLGHINIHVAQGTYDVDSQAGNHIIIPGGITFYGGASQNWSTSDPALYTTTIRDINPLGSADQNNPSRAIEINGMFVVIEGFTVIGASSPNSTAVYITNGANPVLRLNNIQAGSSTTGNVYGVFVDNASPRIETNNIHGGSAENSYGVQSINNANSNIVNNSIYGGDSTIQATSIGGENSTLTVVSNDLDAGSANTVVAVDSVNSYMSMYNNVVANLNAANTSYGLLVTSGSGGSIHNNIIDPNPFSRTNFAIGVYLESSSTPSLINNIVVNGDYCIKEGSVDAHPYYLYHNDLFGCGVIYFDAQGACTTNADGDNDNQTCALAEMQTLTDMTTLPFGNVSDAPLFIDPLSGDFHFSAVSPISVTQGGFPQGASTQDKEGIVRTEPWSMGAYEYDTP